MLYELLLALKLLVAFQIFCIIDGLHLAWGAHRFVANFYGGNPRYNALLGERVWEASLFLI